MFFGQPDFYISFKFFYKLFYLLESGCYMSDRISVGNTRKPFAAAAERGSRNDGDAMLIQQPFAEHFACHAEAPYVRVDVKRAFGLETVYAD